MHSPAMLLLRSSDLRQDPPEFWRAMKPLFLMDKRGMVGRERAENKILLASHTGQMGKCTGTAHVSFKNTQRETGDVVDSFLACARP